MHIFCTGECSKLPKELVERVEALERKQIGLQLEWADALERLTRMLARLRERQKTLERMEPASEQDGAPALQANREVGIVPTTHGLLTPHQKEIQQSILKRRAGG